MFHVISSRIALTHYVGSFAGGSGGMGAMEWSEWMSDQVND
jgi:hypothetical protein